MPGNEFLTPDLIAREALATLYETTVMGSLVHRDHETNFRGKQGDTITVRKPAVFEANEFERSSGIVVQDAEEDGVEVTLDTIFDVSFAVTSEQMTLEIDDFGAQLLTPAIEALGQAVDRRVLTLRDDIVAEVGYGSTEDWDDPLVLVDAGTVLTEANVPLTDRHCVIGPRTSGPWIKTALFHEADKRGDTEGLREASIGRKFGFDNWVTQNIEPAPGDPDPGDPTTEVNVAFHRTAFALVTRTLALPMGAKDAAVVEHDGFGIRVVYDYDVDKKQDVVSLDCLIGVKTMDADRAVLVKGADEPE